MTWGNGNKGRWGSAKGPNDHQKCTACHTRYAQSSLTRLCRQCEKELNQVVEIAYEEKRNGVAKAEQVRQRLLLAQAPRPFVPVCYDGIAFTLIWDGSFKYENPSEAAARFGAHA